MHFTENDAKINALIYSGKLIDTETIINTNEECE